MKIKLAGECCLCGRAFVAGTDVDRDWRGIRCRGRCRKPKGSGACRRVAKAFVSPDPCTFTPTPCHRERGW